MDHGSSFVTNAQTGELVQPSNAALDHPARLAPAAPVGRAALGQFGADAAFMQGIAMRLRIVSPIALHAFGLVQRVTGLAGQRRDRLEQGQELGDVVAVRLGQQAAQRNALRVDTDVVLARAYSASTTP